MEKVSIFEDWNFPPFKPSSPPPHPPISLSLSLKQGGYAVYHLKLMAGGTYLGNMSLPGRESFGASLATFGRSNRLANIPTWKIDEIYETV